MTSLFLKQMLDDPIVLPNQWEGRLLEVISILQLTVILVNKNVIRDYRKAESSRYF